MPGVPRVLRAPAAAGRWVIAAGVLLGAGSGVTAEPAWAPARWSEARPAPQAIEAEGPGAIALRFQPGHGTQPVLEMPDPQTIEIRWPGPAETLLELGPPAPPVADWALTHDGAAYRLTLRLDRRTLAELQPVPDGWRVILGAAGRLLARAPVRTGQDVWAADPELAAMEVELHRAMREAQAGQWGVAITRLVPLSEPGRPTVIQGAALDAEARLLIAGGLPLLAIEPLARAIQLTPDEAHAGRAIRTLRGVARERPGALIFAQPYLAQTWRTDNPDSWWLDLEAGRLLLAARQPIEAAERLVEAARDPTCARRARYLVHVAARLAGAGADADHHLRWLLAQDPSDPVALEAELGLARLSFDRGRLDDAGARYRAILARAPGDPRARAESEWLALRQGQPPRWARLVPFDLDGHGIEHALVVGARYYQHCLPDRAAAVAGGIIDATRRDPLADQLEMERSRIDGASWSSARRRLRARLDRYHQRRDRDRSRQEATYHRRLALRLRISADALRADEVRLRLRADQEPVPPEARFEGWRGDRWLDTDAATLADRCAALGIESPMPAPAIEPEGPQPGAQGPLTPAPSGPRSASRR